MSLHIPTVSRLLRRHTPTESLVIPVARGSARTGAFLLSFLLVIPGSSMGEPADLADDPSPPSTAVAVSVSETPDAVQLRIQVSGAVEPGSVEIQFSGREVVVLARDTAGRAVRSQPVRLPALVVEDGATADYDAADALVMTLRKQAGSETRVPPGGPEALAR